MNKVIGETGEHSLVSDHDPAHQTYFEQEMSSILSTTEQRASPASRTLSQQDIHASRQILHECPEVPKKLPFGHRLGYGVHSSQAVFPLLQLCYRQAPLELIKMAYDANPDALNEAVTQDIGNFTALHWACCGTFTSVEVIKFLVDKHPASLYQMTWGHCTLLHHACGNGLTFDIIQFLLIRCPHHTQERDNHQNVPLHLACGRRDASFEVIKLLTEFDPASVELTSRLGLMESHSGIVYRSGSVYDCMGYTALHYACGEGAPLETIRLLVRLYPTALQLHAPGKALPLHLACSRQFPTLCTIAFLVSQYPRAMQLCTTGSCSDSSGGGGNPLQLCMKSRPALEVVRFLYERHPASSDKITLALQYACCNGASIEIIGYLLEKAKLIHPNTLPGTSNADSFLYSTCSKAASHPLVPSMLERCPDDVRKITVAGNLPLHAACKARAPLSVIRLLVSKYPKALTVPNSDGNLPLHLLVKRRTNFSENMIAITQLRYLVEQNVAALKTRNRQDKIPIDLALEYLFPGPSPSPRQSYVSHASFHEEMKSQTPMEVLHLLTPRRPEFQVTARSGVRTSLPIHYVPVHLQFLSNSYPSRVQTVLSFLCQKDPESCHRINDLGEMPLHLACRKRGVAEATIEFLFAQYPDAIHVRNREGLYPFELAASANTPEPSENDLESLGVVYFLVHRSLFAFENLALWRDHDLLHNRLCNLENGERESTKRNMTKSEQERRRYQQQTLTEILEEREENINGRLRDLEMELLDLKQKRLEESSLNQAAQSTCCLIS